ncbi:aminoglycoside phosphotransferase family protein [Pseudoalteromonas xiamenensis]|uniref:aminoglycoside phosphotransferase family protein n=1 Tax=Pseudoalteromonas xiamenensis TaxID=882626 RepID=UPI0035E6812F
MTDLDCTIQHFLLHRAALNDFDCEPITGDASFRQYWRVSTPSSQYVLMVSNPALVDPTPFIELNQAFQLSGLRVPNIVAKDLSLGYVLLEDLGNVHLANRLNEPNRIEHYKALIDLLPLVAKTPNHPAMRPYNDDFVAMEMGIFKEWLVEKMLGVEMSASQQTAWNELVNWIVQEFNAQPKVTMHRDFHSRNVMSIDNDWAIIDYQDAVQGPLCYDLVSLLRDCYVKLPDNELGTLLNYGFETMQKANVAGTLTFDAFSRAFDITGMQRHLKAAGIFCRLYLRDGKAGYLANIIPTLQYILDISKKFQHSQWLESWLEHDIIPAMVNKLGEIR